VHSFIETYLGEAFEPLNPDSDRIFISDIAHALSQQCRFSGHTKEFYSVAEHCVRVSWLLQDWEEPRTVQLWGLMHDASEAYLVDVPMPLKRHPSFEAYRAAEEAVMWSICARFDLPVEEPSAVKLADQAMLATEARDLMPFVPEHWAEIKGMADPDIQITPWQPREAKRKFLNRFCDLTRT
jgi:5'-deoxynucleotidase YfbR-like HD superfamily hydrolase